MDVDFECVDVDDNIDEELFGEVDGFDNIDNDFVDGNDHALVFEEVTETLMVTYPICFLVNNSDEKKIIHA